MCQLTNSTIAASVESRVHSLGKASRTSEVSIPQAAQIKPTSRVDTLPLPPDSPLKSGWYSDLPEDRPFGNTTVKNPVSLHPKHFQAVLDARTISATEKSKVSIATRDSHQVRGRLSSPGKQLKAMLAKDAILSCFLLVVVLSLAASALYLAKATFNFTPSTAWLASQSKMN